MKVYFETYGCTLNRADTDLMKGLVKNRGWRVVETPEEADVIVLNTCTVKSRTENKIISRIERLKDKKVVIAGCMSVIEERVRKAKKDVVMLPAQSAGMINSAIELAGKGGYGTIKGGMKWGEGREYSSPILRIALQEGCLGNCYFCQTKFARPKLISYPKEWIMEQVKEGIQRGAKEIQLTGMDTGAYGIEKGERLGSLLKEVLSTEGDFMVRLGMLNPIHSYEIKNEIKEMLRHKKFYGFVHIPVQSGSPKVLREMNRRHGIKEFVESAREFRKEGATIATDIIAGYPTETEEDFEKTKEMLLKMKPDVINVSGFASRKGTRAAGMDKLPTQIIKNRTRELSKLVNRITRENNEKFIGKEMDVLITENGKGRSREYKQVVAEGELGEWIRVRIKDANHGSLFGELI